MLSLETFGELRIWRGGERIDGQLPSKATAMLVYLAANGGRARRTRLAGLLWSDQSEERARANLRVMLSRLRREAEAVIDADRETVGLVGPFALDASELVDADPSSVADLYQGEFVSDLDVPGAELFEDWVNARRADLRAIALRGLTDGAMQSHDAQDWPRCERFTNAILRIDPWHEQAHRWTLRALASVHGPAAAAAHFDHFAARLEAEIGATPNVETISLIDTIRAQPSANSTDPLILPAQAIPPTWTTKLVGREGELANIEHLVEQGRPVSIVGPGGIGKSRLLAEFAHRKSAAGEAVAYVGFDGHAPTPEADTQRAFAETVLVALGVPADSERSAPESLHRFLQSQRLTLCLDNVEQLAGVERALVDLGRACPRLTVVLSSRRLPELVQGRIIEVAGLAHHSPQVDQTPAVSAAEVLFLDRAMPTSTDEDELRLVTQICAALDGHPLAIELAAHWARTASITELAELVQTADRESSFTTDAPDLPQRHRSLDVLVEASIDQVSTEARWVLHGASHFAGPFTRDDIDAVVTLSGNELTELVRYSLVSANEGAYQLHPVIRRFARHRLAWTEGADELERNHARRMVAIMETIGDPLTSGRQFQRRAADLRAAINWMIENAESSELLGPLTTYLGYQRAWGWFESSHETIRKTLERRDLPAVDRAELHRHAGEAMLHAARYDDAVVELERGLKLVRSPIPSSRWARRRWSARQVASLGIAPLRVATPGTRRRAAERARLMGLLGEVFYVSDRRAEMLSYGLGSLSAGRLSRDPILASAGDAAVSIASQLTGAHRLSEHYRARARRRATTMTANPFTATETWGITALVAAGAGHWDDARSDIERAISAGALSGRTRMISQLEILSALVDYHDERYDEALAVLHATQASIEHNGFRRALTWVHATRAEAALRIGDLSLARAAATSALETAIPFGRPEDEARAIAARARATLDAGQDLDPRDLDAILPGLTSPSALAFQHFELHFGAARLAAELRRRHPTESAASHVADRQLSGFVKAFPIAERRAALR